LSQTRTTNRGLPQGSCLSPFLFAVFLNPMLESVARFVNISAYADDVALWVLGSDVEEMSRQLQLALGVVEDWLGERHMLLSPEKSQLVVFRRGQDTTRASLQIAGQVVHSITEVKYLGVTLDSSLSWAGEVRALRSRLSNNSRILMRLAGNSNLARRSVLRGFYLSYIQSCLDYHLHFFFVRLQGRCVLSR